MATALGAIGCGAGAPLLHPAHVLAPGFVSLGAGVSATAAVGSAGADPGGAVLRAATVSTGVSPWVAARIGLEGSNEAGITYTGRSARLDARHAFDLGVPTLSIGLGATVIIPERPGSQNQVSNGIFGGGLDLPILIGVHSRSDLFALWIGPRAGFELLGGTVAHTALVPSAVTDPAAPEGDDLSGTHLFVGGVAGLRAGFRHVHAALEIDAGYHRAKGTFTSTPPTSSISASIATFAVTPAGAIIVSF